MKIGRSLELCLFAVVSLVASSCHRLPGQPASTGEAPRPDQVTDFAALYSRNCAGCHGVDGTQGASIPLSDPLYQAVVDDGTLRDVITNGRPGSHMPAFAQSAGGMLTENQIDALVHGMREHWLKAGNVNSQAAPPYRASAAGNPQRGAQAYSFYCASCHGGIGEKPGKNGSIVDPSFLQLIDDQSLRTLVIVGRPDLGMPNWRNRVPGHPISNREITDLVAWLSSQRAESSGGAKAAGGREGGL